MTEKTLLALSAPLFRLIVCLCRRQFGSNFWASRARWVKGKKLIMENTRLSLFLSSPAHTESNNGKTRQVCFCWSVRKRTLGGKKTFRLASEFCDGTQKNSKRFPRKWKASSVSLAWSTFPKETSENFYFRIRIVSNFYEECKQLDRYTSNCIFMIGSNFLSFCRRWIFLF